jgi:hypothetical protein
MATRFEITVDDYVACGKLNGEMTRRSRIAHAAIDGILIVSGILAWTYGQSLLAAALVGAGIGAFLIPWGLGRTFIPWYLKRHFAKYPKIRKPIEIDFDDDGIRFTSSDEIGVLRWDEIHRWRADDNYLLLYPAPRIYHLVPRRIERLGFPMKELMAHLSKRVGSAA